jgi:hypothetical protein
MIGLWNALEILILLNDIVEYMHKLWQSKSVQEVDCWKAIKGKVNT